MPKPIIFVSGLGRCGTSLVMQMLNAAGIQCAGDYPSFEPDAMKAFDRPVDSEWINGQAGRAVKWLDPHKVKIDTTSLNAVVIWLYREKRQQAKSQVKFMETVSGEKLNRSKVLRLTKILREETASALKAISAFNGCSIRFEALINNPFLTAGELAAFIERAGFELPPDAIEKMAAQVLPRHTNCMPDMSVELQLVSRVEAV